MERKWGNDNGGSSGWRTAAFKDKDGSVTGVPNSYIVNNIGILAGIEACEVKPGWNAAVCKGDLGRMNVGGGGGGFGGARGGGARGGGAPRAGGAPPRAGGAPPGAATGPGAGAARGGAAAGGPGARAGGAGAAPAQPPVVLSRNGKEFTVTGETTVVAGTQIKVTTERPTLPISVSQLDSGSWVIFELPGFTTAASGTQQDSLDALRKAGVTSYYKGPDALWVKVVSAGGGGGGAGARGGGFVGGGGGSIQVSR
jgi:cell migration-inducing and hyaluronan-binding protein